MVYPAQTKKNRPGLQVRAGGEFYAAGTVAVPAGF
jgi:hypothetical protein